MRYAKAVDANQAAIVTALRRAGALVQDLSAAGEGVPDLLVGWHRQFLLFEVKDGNKPPSARALTGPQARFHVRWQGYPLHVVESVDEALRVLLEAKWSSPIARFEPKPTPNERKRR
jgi:hypothetical protein